MPACPPVQRDLILELHAANPQANVVLGNGDEVDSWSDLAGGEHNARAGVFCACEECPDDPTFGPPGPPHLMLNATPLGQPAIDFRETAQGGMADLLSVEPGPAADGAFRGNDFTWFIVFQADHVGSNTTSLSPFPRLVSNVLDEGGVCTEQWGTERQHHAVLL